MFYSIYYMVKLNEYSEVRSTGNAVYNLNYIEGQEKHHKE